MPASTNGTLKAKVRSLLRYGKENARTGIELATVLGFKKDRLVRLALRELIADGVPVISLVKPPYGSYIADSPEEVMEYLGELRHRALEILGRYKDLKLAAQEILQPCQLGLL